MLGWWSLFDLPREVLPAVLALLRSRGTLEGMAPGTVADVGHMRNSAALQSHVRECHGNREPTTTSRVLQLLGLLQSRRVWSGEELAERLGVTGRSVRRDVERLRDLGYPVHASKGHGGGYQLGAGAALPPLLLDPERGRRDGRVPARRGGWQRRGGRRVRAARAVQARPGDAVAAAVPGLGGARRDGDADVRSVRQPRGARRADDAGAGQPRPRTRHGRVRRPAATPPNGGWSPTSW